MHKFLSQIDISQIIENLFDGAGIGESARSTEDH